MSFVDDFDDIAAALKAKQAEKPKPEVTEGQPSDWADTVYGMYGNPSDSNVQTYYPHGYLEAFEAYKSAANSTPYQYPVVGLRALTPSEFNDLCRHELINRPKS